MKFPEYVRTVYPIKDIVEQIKQNPIQQVIDRDDLPYDSIKRVDDEFVKVVEYGDEGDFIPILELVSLTKEELERIDNQALTDVYNTYMSKVEILDVDLTTLINASREYQKSLQQKEKWLSHVCS